MGSQTKKNKSNTGSTSRHYSLYKQRNWHSRTADEAARAHTPVGKGEPVDPSRYAFVQISTLRIP